MRGSGEDCRGIEQYGKKDREGFGHNGVFFTMNDVEEVGIIVD